MKRWVPLFLLLCCTAGSSANLSRWKINLEQSQGLQSFDREVGAQWMIQQGVLMLTPDRVLVYQVNRSTERPKLAPRDASGGAGNFVLKIKVLSMQDGHLIKSLDLPTNGELSSVMAMSAGRFIARTGATLTLYSADFRLLASRELPLVKEAPFEDWEIGVSPSGASVVLVHEQIFRVPEVLLDNSVVHDGKARVDVELLDAETLQSKKTFTLSHSLPTWSLADEFLFSSNPAHSYIDGQVGTLGFDGNWSAIPADSRLTKEPCPYAVTAMDQQRFVLYGCDAFTVVSAAGKSLYTHNDSRFVFRSVDTNGAYLAAACDHYRVERGTDSNAVLGTRADRIEVYDLDRRARLFSVQVHSERAYYAVSGQGELVVVDGSNLEVIQAGR